MAIVMRADAFTRLTSDNVAREICMGCIKP